MKIEIKDEVFDKFNKKFLVGLIICKGLNNEGDSSEIHHMLKELEEYIKLNFNPITIKTHDLISVWQTAVEGFGKVKNYKSSVEKMMEMALKNKEIPRENLVGDLCNFISLKYIVPLDQIDLEELSGDLEFGVKGKDLVLREGGIIISKKFAYTKNKDYEVSKKTKDSLIYLEAIPPLTESRVLKIVEELADLVKTFCKGRIKAGILNSKKKEIKI
ncbi:hypothetical protein ACFLZB_02560 [Nanoarchaeota archaeon]